MITGIVNANREAIIHLQAHGSRGQEQAIEAIVDTGFTGSLTLPPALVATLELTWLTQGRAILGDGREQLFDSYAATITWDGQPLRIMVDAADTDPLVGMTLMHGYELNVLNIDGGTVTLRPLSNL